MTRKKVVVSVTTTLNHYHNAILAIPKESRVVDYLNVPEREFFVIKDMHNRVKVINTAHLVEIEVIKEED